MSTSYPVKDLTITFHCDDKLYIIERPFIQVSKEVCWLLQIVNVYNWETFHSGE
jgi:hypothetical protein